MSAKKVIACLEKEIRRESKIIEYMEERKKNMPSGSLSVKETRYEKYYYHMINENGKKSSVYIDPDHDGGKELIKMLMEKRSITHGLPILKSNVKQMNSIIKKIREYDPLSNRFGDQLGPEYYPEDEVCIRDWLGEKYIRNPYKSEQIKYETKSGIMVRSKSEIMIADILSEFKIPFRVEGPLVLRNKTIYPDFELLDIKNRKLVWWEHFGMMNDPGYAMNTIAKIDLYAENGIVAGNNLIMTWEDETHPINRSIIIRKLRRYSFI